MAFIVVIMLQNGSKQAHPNILILVYFIIMCRIDIYDALQISYMYLKLTLSLSEHQEY